jgi:hypothetical protein
MTRIFSRLAGLVTLTLALSTFGLTSGALASSAGPTKVGPHQYFAGMINGKVQNATVEVVCPPSGAVGRALPGQTISVTLAAVIATSSGYTGSKAHAIQVNIGPAATPVPTVLFTSYNQISPFPTDVPVPCAGTEVVAFSPVPSSKRAKAATVTVSYVNVSTGSGG